MMKNNLFLSILIAYQFVIYIYNVNASSHCNGAIRLSNGNEHGSTNHYGVVNIFYNNTWGNICDDSVSSSGDPVFTVVCKQLGYDTVAEGFTESDGNPWGDGTASTWLDNIECTGTESNPGECDHDDWGDHNCGPNEAISVNCTGFNGEYSEELNHMLLLGEPCEDHSDCCNNNLCYNDVCMEGFDALDMSNDALDTCNEQNDELNDKLDALLADSSDSKGGKSKGGKSKGGKSKGGKSKGGKSKGIKSKGGNSYASDSSSDSDDNNAFVMAYGGFTQKHSNNGEYVMTDKQMLLLNVLVSVVTSLCVIGICFALYYLLRKWQIRKQKEYEFVPDEEKI